MTGCMSEKHNLLKEGLRLWTLFDHIDKSPINAVDDEDLVQLRDFRDLIHLQWSQDFSFEEKLNESVEHILNYINIDESSVVGTTYKNLRRIVAGLDPCYISERDSSMFTDLEASPVTVKMEPIDYGDNESQKVNGLREKASEHSDMQNHITDSDLSSNNSHSPSFKDCASKPGTTTKGRHYACFDCGGRQFANKGSLDRHRRQHTGERPFTCAFCPKTFVSASNCSKHTKRRHTPASEKKSVDCSICGRLFSDRTYLQEHVKQQHLLPSTDGNRLSAVLREPADDAVSSAASPSPSVLQSESQSMAVLRHQSSVPAFACTICNREFPYQSSLKEHMRIHTEERAFQCELCGKSFKRTGDLTVHARFHDRQKRFSCTTCGQTFAWKNGLVRHTRVHTGEKPYLCNTCGRSFAGYSNHRKHQKVHAREAALSAAGSNSASDHHSSVV